MLRRPLLMFVAVFSVCFALTEYLAYQQYQIVQKNRRIELIHEATEAKDRLRNILFNDIAAANTLAVIYKQYGVPVKFDSVVQQIIQNSRYAEGLQISENGIVKNVYAGSNYKSTIGSNINDDPKRKTEEVRAIEKKDIHFAGPRRLKFGDTGIVGKLPVIVNNKVPAVITVLTRLPALKKAIAAGENKQKFTYQLLKIQGKDTSAFSFSNTTPGNGRSVTVKIPEGDWLLRVNYAQSFNSDNLLFELSGLGLFFSVACGLLAYRKAQEPLKLNKIITEKTEQLAKSEKYFRTLIETSSDAVVLMDHTGHVLYQSPSAEKILGYTLSEIQQIEGLTLIHPEDREKDNQAFYTEISEPGAIVARSHRIKHKNGGYIYIEGTYRNLLRDDSIKAIVYSYKDVTEKILSEKAFAESEDRFRRAFEDSAIGMGLTSIQPDSMGRWLKVNRSLYEMLGYTEEELLSRTFLEITHPDDLARDLAAQDRILNGEGDTYRLEKRYIHKNGSFVWINLNVSIVKDNNNQPIYLVAQVENITERVKSQNLLAESESRFRRAFEDSAIGMGLCTINEQSVSQWIKVNQPLCKMFGYTEEELLTMTLAEMTHPDDLEKSLIAREGALNGLYETYRIEKRYLHKNGSPIWANVHASVIRDKDNQPMYLITQLENITERIMAQNTLIESEVRFRSIFEDSTMGMALTSVEEHMAGKYLKVNRALCEMLGYTEEELLSRTFMENTHPDDLTTDLAARDSMLQSLAETYRVEKRYIHKNGSIVWASLNVSVIRDKEKHPLYLLAQVEDVTEKRESQVKFQSLVEESIVGVYILQNERVVYANPRLLQETGYTEEDITGMPITRFVYTDDLELVNEIMHHRINEGLNTIRYEARVQRKDGTPIWYEFFGSTTMYKGAPALIGTMVDMTGRKAAENEINRLTRLYQFMGSINEAMLKAKNNHQVYADACRVAIEVGGFRVAWISVYDERKDTITPIAWSGHDDGFLKIAKIEGEKVSTSGIPSARAVQQKKPIYFNDIANDPDIHAEIKAEMIKRQYLSGLSIPIFVEGKIAAVLALITSEPFFFNDSEVELLRDVTENITYALEKIRIQTLQNRSEANLRSVFDNTHVAYLLLNTDYNIVSFNQKMKDIYINVANTELKEEMNLIENVIPEKRENVRNLYDTVIETNQPLVYETAYVKDGETLHFLANVIPIYDGKAIIGICISTIEITEQKKLTENLLTHVNEIERQNEKLRDIAWMQSHVIRAPLARIMGLIDLINNHNDDEDENSTILDYILLSANELDDVIKDITKKVYDN